MNNQNKKHWDALNIKYSNVWISKAKKNMSSREMSFISSYLIKFMPKRILDMGVGNGRVLNNLIENSSNNVDIFGIDISEKMVEICKNRFKNENKVKDIRICNISSEAICFDDNFDFITAIRVLKYNQNWWEILEKLYNRLNNNGVFIFTMLNNNSINRFSKYDIPLYRTDKKELRSVLQNIGFEILDIKSFTKIPDYFYDLSNNTAYVSLLILFEKFLEKILGQTFLGRILFICVQK